MKTTHTHRITPGHQGGCYTSDNTIEAPTSLCNKETALHPMWHYANWRLWGKKEDFCAWKGLSAQIEKREIIDLMMREGSRRSVEVRRNRGTGFWDPEVQRRGGSAAIKKHIEENPNYQSDVGKRGGKKCAQEKIGFCGLSFEERSKQSRKVSSKLYVDPDHPELGHRTATALHRMQTKRGFPNKPENRTPVLKD